MMEDTRLLRMFHFSSFTSLRDGGSWMPNLSDLVKCVKEVLYLVSVMAAAISGVSAMVFHYAWPSIITSLSEELNVATKEDIATINQRIDEITGENNIIQMMPGHSYVTEPVVMGDVIEVLLVARRTNHGAKCVSQRYTPIFVDLRSIPQPGAQFIPFKQLSTVYERLPLQFELPDNLVEGRVRMFLSVEYLCPFGKDGNEVRIFEETSPLFFILNPRNDDGTTARD